MSIATDVSPAAEELPEKPVAAARSWSIVPLLTRLHFYTGVLMAPLLVVAAVTGLLFVFTPQLDNLVYDKELHVAQVGPGLPKPLSEQVAAAVAAHPDGTLASVQPASAPDATTRVTFNVPELGEKQHTVYVDPYTGEIRGQLTTWWGSTPLTTWLDDLHRNLHLGDVGRVYSETAASWLWVLALGGLVLWCNRQWRRRAGTSRARGRAEATLLYDLDAAKGVRRTRSFHAATGIWLVAGLLVLSATGLTWSRWAGDNFGLALDSLDSRTPELNTALVGGSAPSGGGGHHGEGGAAAAGDPAQIDAVLHVARGAGFTGAVEIAPPAEEGAAWSVTQTDNVWPVHLDRIAVDPVAGTVAARSNFADWPVLAQLTKFGIQAHMGRLFGLANQLLLAALAIGLLSVIVWGYRMWWQRRPTRADRRAAAGPPPARGAWRRLRLPVLVAGILVTAAIGWALPVFGVTLLAFLVLDAAVGLVRRLRRKPPVPASPSPADA
ncbi:PepSY domain-containing protein [Dactylosporangium sp. AC04546]|uniref:PepSY-associated TM helix domain-containing protein n=1 Tax=Dactylosporangium sp. AC04546 TaxID=2862460 RepID=UPI0027DEF9D4|nr:PepSY domain-containing protein [Dactylosporangium sp. AC04546]WVK79355.1 PepSY domain-containing protein [Dactylosporangium sp. AC04546]